MSLKLKELSLVNYMDSISLPVLRLVHLLKGTLHFFEGMLVFRFPYIWTFDFCRFAIH